MARNLTKLDQEIWRKPDMDQEKTQQLKRLVIANGNLCNADHWADVDQQLGKDVSLVVPDLRDCSSMQDMAEVLQPELDGQSALIGYSMGGYAALETWRRYSDKIPALGLVATQAYPDDDKARDMRRVMLEKVHEGNFDKFIGNVIKLDIPEPQWTNQPLCDRIRRNCHEVGLTALRNHQRAMMGRPDSRPDLEGINVPVLVAVGRQDIVTPPHLSQEIADAAPNSSLHIIEQCGHMPSIERPEELATIFRGWLQKIAK